MSIRKQSVKFINIWVEVRDYLKIQSQKLEKPLIYKK